MNFITLVKPAPTATTPQSENLMTPVSAPAPTSITPTSIDVTHHARAYCGPAHGQSWVIGCDTPLADQVTLGNDGDASSYQLVRDAQTGRPARDRHGNFLYMPERYGNAPSAGGPTLTAREFHLLARPTRTFRSCA